MKRMILFALLIIPMVLFGTTYNTITVNDNLSDWDSDESFTTSTSEKNNYITWDEDNLYFGFDGIYITDNEGYNQSVFIVIDVDPHVPITSGYGTTNLGYEQWYLGSTVNVPFNADYILSCKAWDSSPEKNTYVYNNGTSIWDKNPSGAPNWSVSWSTNNCEISIARNEIGNPSQIHVTTYGKDLSSNDGWGWIYSALDESSIDGNGDKTIDKWRGFTLSSGISPNTTGSDQSLPVTLTSFSAKAVKGTVVLEWETSAEIENQGFVISRQSTVDSRDGLQPRPEIIASFATDDALKGQGSTTETTQYRYVDTGVELGKTYVYTLADVDYEGKETLLEKVEVQVGAEGAIVADGYALDPLYHNPFNATLTIPFTLTESMNVSIDLYSITGQKMMTVVNREFGAGSYNYTVQTNDLASGMYVVRTSFNGRNHMQKAVLLK